MCILIGPVIDTRDRRPPRDVVDALPVAPVRPAEPIDPPHAPCTRHRPRDHTKPVDHGV